MFENKHKQSVKPKSGSIKSKDNFKQLAVPFKDYIDFESVLKGVKNNHRNNNSLSLKNIKVIFFGVMLRKLYVLRIYLMRQLFFTKEKRQSINSLEQFLKSMDIVER